MEPLLRIGLTNALLATVLAIVVALLARLCRRPALTHALWLLVLLRLIMPPFLPVPVPWRVTRSAVSREEAASTTALTAAPNAAPLPDAAVLVDAEPSLPSAQELPGLPEPGAVMQLDFPDRTAVLAVFWLAGSIGWWSLAAWRLARFRIVLESAREAPTEVTERVRILAGRLGLRQPPLVLMIDAPLSPMLWALVGRPRLLLPRSLWEQLAPAQQDALLVHELAHLRRGDPWVRRLELVLVGLYWWHPVVWWACQALHEAEEECCDAWVVWALPDAAEAYADLLVRTVCYLTKPDQAVPLSATGMGRIRSLERRLRMIVLGPRPRRLSLGGLALLLGLMVVLPLTPRLARPEEGPTLTSAVEEPTTGTSFDFAFPTAPAFVAQSGAPRPDEQPLSPSPLKYINSQRLRLNYKVQNLQTTGSEEVQVWYTRNGSDWALSAQRQKTGSPVVLELAGEGRYGFTLVVRDKDGNGKPPPRKGDQPQVQVEVDVTPPELALSKPIVDRVKKTVTLDWKVTDRNPGAPAVQIWTQWGDRSEAAWVEGKEKGPLTIPYQPERGSLHYRIVARDRAGNTTEVEGGTVPGTGPEPEVIITDVEAASTKSNVNLTPQAPDVLVTHQREMSLPFQISRNTDITELRLYVTRDNSRTWELAARATPKQKHFVYHAPDDGLYGFTVQAIDRDAQELPEPGPTPNVMLRILVDTKKGSPNVSTELPARIGLSR